MSSSIGTLYLLYRVYQHCLAPKPLPWPCDCRRRIGIVTQDPILFKGTILSNLTYGCPSASRADAIEAASMANALEFINSFPGGLETECGERGVQLSGGYVMPMPRQPVRQSHQILMLLAFPLCTLQSKAKSGNRTR